MEGFRAIINSPLLRPGMPGIMETPNDSPTADEENLSTVKGLVLLAIIGNPCRYDCL